MKNYTRDELIDLVKKIRSLSHNEKEQDLLILELERNVLDPEVANFRRWDGKTAEEIIDIALSYQPIILGDGSI